jgi:hypothetical protein
MGDDWFFARNWLLQYHVDGDSDNHHGAWLYRGENIRQLNHVEEFETLASLPLCA